MSEPNEPAGREPVQRMTLDEGLSHIANWPKWFVVPTADVAEWGKSAQQELAALRAQLAQRQPAETDERLKPLIALLAEAVESYARWDDRHEVLRLSLLGCKNSLTNLQARAALAALRELPQSPSVGDFVSQDDIAAVEKIVAFARLFTDNFFNSHHRESEVAWTSGVMGGVNYGRVSYGELLEFVGAWPHIKAALAQPVSQSPVVGVPVEVCLKHISEMEIARTTPSGFMGGRWLQAMKEFKAVVEAAERGENPLTKENERLKEELQDMQERLDVAVRDCTAESVIETVDREAHRVLDKITSDPHTDTLLIIQNGIGRAVAEYRALFNSECERSTKIRERAEQAEARAERLAAVLRSVEWILRPDGIAQRCPTCGLQKYPNQPTGMHSHDCELAAALADSPAESPGASDRGE